MTTAPRTEVAQHVNRALSEPWSTDPSAHSRWYDLIHHSTKAQGPGSQTYAWFQAQGKVFAITRPFLLKHRTATSPQRRLSSSADRVCYAYARLSSQRAQCCWSTAAWRWTDHLGVVLDFPAENRDQMFRVVHRIHRRIRRQPRDVDGCTGHPRT